MDAVQQSLPFVVWSLDLGHDVIDNLDCNVELVGGVGEFEELLVAGGPVVIGSDLHQQQLDFIFGSVGGVDVRYSAQHLN
jgi:hypothetical protein